MSLNPGSLASFEASHPEISSGLVIDAYTLALADYKAVVDPECARGAGYFELQSRVSEWQNSISITQTTIGE